MITATSTDEAFYVVAQALCACVTAALPSTRGGMVDRVCCAVPGGIAWDQCECGQLAVSIGDSFYSNNFPAPDATQPQNACGPTYWGAPITVELARCVPGPGPNGAPPTCEQLAASARVLESDRQVISRALACCLKDLYDVQAGPTSGIGVYTLGSAEVIGPQGMCAGLRWTMNIGLINCTCGS